MTSNPGRVTRRFAAAALRALALSIVFALPSYVRPPAAAASPATFHIEPAVPCPSDEVRLVFGICTCNTHWIHLGQDASGLVRLDLQFDPRVQCVQCGPDTMSIAIGRFAAGNYTVQFDIVSHITGATGADSIKVEREQVVFAVSPTCSTPIPYLESVRIGQPTPCNPCPPTVCAGDSIMVYLAGVFPDACVRVREIRRLPSPLAGPLPEPDLIQIVYEDRSRCATCGLSFVPWSAALPIGPLPTRSAYNLIVQALLVDACNPESLTFLGAHLEPFAVGAVCGPQPEPLQHVDNVFIGRGDQRVVCAGDSIPVVVQGHFDTDCIQFDEIVAAPNIPVDGTLPGARMVQVIYRVNSCIDVACHTGFFPFAGSVRLPPIPGGGDYRLAVQEYLRDDCHPGALTPLGAGAFPFAVLDTCGQVHPGCFFAGFVHTPSTGGCDAYYGKNMPAEATFGVNSGAPLGGLQGSFVFDQPGLRVTGIEAIPAGALLSWQPTATGAEFVVVDASKGTLVDASIPGSPLLRVRVEPLLRAGTPDVIRLEPRDLFGSDPQGRPVGLCPIPANVRMEDPAARFCREAACDFNNDLATDVRDLVLMLNCMRDTVSSCQGIDLARLDCDGDGDRDVDDVLCCARILLAHPLPDSSSGSPAPGVTLRFGAPQVVAGGVDVPVTLSGSNALGAARLAFDYPDAVFESASIELANATPGWLALDQAAGGHAVFGAIRLANNIALGAAQVEPSSLQLVMHLRTRAGQAPAGSVGYTGGDFSDPTGAALVTAANPVAMPLAGGPRLSLGAAHPNPFAGETTISLALTQDADVDLSVYDLVGRKVATLFHGRATAGTRDFTWRRTRDDGAAVSSGVYFYRATANGDVAGGKVLVLSRE